jgi:hypothetical protein
MVAGQGRKGTTISYTDDVAPTPDRVLSEIKLEMRSHKYPFGNGTGTTEPTPIYVGYDQHGKKAYEWKYNSVNVTFA